MEGLKYPLPLTCSLKEDDLVLLGSSAQQALLLKKLVLQGNSTLTKGEALVCSVLPARSVLTQECHLLWTAIQAISASLILLTPIHVTQVPTLVQQTSIIRLNAPTVCLASIVWEGVSQPVANAVQAMCVQKERAVLLLLGLTPSLLLLTPSVLLDISVKLGPQFPLPVLEATGSKILTSPLAICVLKESTAIRSD